MLSKPTQSCTFSDFSSNAINIAVKPQSRQIAQHHVKKKIESTHNSRYPKLAQRVTMDVNRGTRMTQCRLLSDLTPCPGYATEWSVAFHSPRKGYSTFMT